jgi:DNA repair protein RadA/Sms
VGDGRKPLAAFGEIGLTGEVRHVAHPDRRLAEAKKFGLDAIVGPDSRTLRGAIKAAFANARPSGDAADLDEVRRAA